MKIKQYKKELIALTCVVGLGAAYGLTSSTSCADESIVSRMVEKISEKKVSNGVTYSLSSVEITYPQEITNTPFENGIDTFRLGISKDSSICTGSFKYTNGGVVTGILTWAYDDKTKIWKILESKEDK